MRTIAARRSSSGAENRCQRSARRRVARTRWPSAREQRLGPIDRGGVRRESGGRDDREPERRALIFLSPDAARRRNARGARAVVGGDACRHARMMIETRLGEEIDHRTGGTGLRIARTVDEPGKAGVHDRARTHRAGLERDVDRAIREPVIAEAAAASRNAVISACAVGSLAAIGALPPRPTILSSHTTTAPTGTSPRAPAWRASVSACAIQCSSVARIVGIDATARPMGEVRGRTRRRRERACHSHSIVAGGLPEMS